MKEHQIESLRVLIHELDIAAKYHFFTDKNMWNLILRYRDKIKKIFDNNRSMKKEKEMISVKRCKCNYYGSKNNNRLELNIGDKKYHISRNEAKKLRSQLNRFNLD